MIIIDGTGQPMGRLASFVAKTTLQGDEVSIINCAKVIITGNKKMIQDEFYVKRNRFGHSQKGPKHHATTEKIVKRAVRGMLPNFREGRGKIAFKKIRCYVGIPKELEGKKIEILAPVKRIKFSHVEEFSKK